MKASDNEFPKVTLAESASPGTPTSGLGYIYVSTGGTPFFVNDAGTQTSLLGSGGLADQGAFTYLDATEAAAPGTPASGKVRIYAKTDGRIYSRDDAGTEYGPFDAAGGGGADLTNYRLGTAYSDGGSPSIGTYGDEFEYETQSDVTTAGWAATNSLPTANWRPCGSSILLVQDESTGGRGLVFDTGSNLPDNFEVAVLLSNYNGGQNMPGIGITDTSGNGILVSPQYSGLAYTFTLSAYAYSATGTSGTALTTAQLVAPHWLALRRASATDWRFRWSSNGSTWTTVVASRTQTVSNARNIFIGPSYTAGSTEVMIIHRLLYGTPDLGL